MTPELAAIFATNFNIYQKIIAGNYMRHAEMGAQTQVAFEGLEIKHPLHVLDFGCGDAQPIIPKLKLRSVAAYTGYDLSAVALEFAKQNLKAVDCQVQLRELPMQAFIELEMGNFDIIHSSYAIHHLQDDEKRHLLQNCFNRLRNGGIMIVIDIFRNEGQSRHDYIEEYISNIGLTWQTITQAEKEMVYYHMRNYDFPAYTGDIINWAGTVGFTIEEHHIDRLHTMLLLKKS